MYATNPSKQHERARGLNLHTRPPPCVQFRHTSFLASTGHYYSTTACGLSESDRACVLQCEAGCRWWNDAECLGSCEMARVQLGKPLPAVGCD